MINNKKFNILIIDNNKDFNNELANKIQQYKFNVTQIFEEKDILQCIVKSHEKIDLIVLNIDFDDNTLTKIFEFISTHTISKVILLSSEDIGRKREEYFSQGILDYHLTSQKIDHTVDDIIDSIYSLYSNQNETILIIEGSEEISLKLEQILRQRNYNILTANSALDGLEQLKNNEISLLILDMEIEDINALDLLDGLRDMYLLNDFYVLSISKHKNPSIVRDSLKNGAKDFMLKPFLYEELLLKIDILVNASRNRKMNTDQKKQIENNLKSFKELLNSSIGGMFIFENNICTNCNTEAVTFLGYNSKESVLNKHIFDIFTDVSDTHKAYLLAEDVDHNFEDTMVNEDKEVYQVQIKERNIQIEDKIVKIIAVMDITDVKRNEKIISQQTKMASMGEMIGNIAHQWRQPLNAISVAAGGIKLNYEFDMEDRDETIVELDNIVENTKFLSSTIESFQNFLKVDKVTTEFNIETACQKTLTIIGANLKANKISIIEEYTSDLKIIGIENELVQVFLNIINNAADILSISSHIDHKYIKIRIFCDKDKIYISIHDNAEGIPEEIINKIFDPYFTTKHQSQGTGLGLYMTHQIIENMGGDIKAENKKLEVDGKNYYGANFVISFPLNK